MSSDSPADLTAEYYASREICCLPYPYEMGGEQRMDDLFTTMTSKQFFDAMAAGADTKTAQPNAEDFVKYFTPFLEAGKDVRYYENIEGGHGGAANNAQAAHMSALAYTFLWQQLTK